MRLTEIADRIHAHLERMEADPAINTEVTKGITQYYKAHAYRGGRFVRVRYVCYQHTTSLTKAEAAQYLAWLDAGNNGKHYQAGLGPTRSR